MEIEIKPFEEVIQDITRKFRKIPKSQYLEDGEFAIIDQSQAFISGYTDEKDKVNSDNLPVIIFGDHTKNLKYVDFPISLGADGAKALSPKSDKYDVKYLYYALKQLKLPEAGYSRHFKYLKERHLPIPKNISDQKRIAQVLSDCEDLIDKRKESIALLDEFVKSIFLEMFGDPFTNPYGLPLKNLKYVAKEEKNAIVDGPFGSSLKNKDYHKSGIPIIRINNIRDEGFYGNEFKYISPEKYQELIRSKVDYNDILIARVGNSIGKSCVFREKHPALLSTTGVAKASIDHKKAEVDFISQQMRLPQYRKYIWNQTAGGGQPYLNLTKIKAFKLIVPDKDAQKKYVQIVKRIENLKTIYKSHLLELKNLKHRLSQDAFKGHLDLRKFSIQGDQKASTNPTKQVIHNELDYSTLFSIKDVDTYLENKLKNNFKNKEFTFVDLKELLIADFSSRYNQYDYDKWKNNFFDILGEKSSYITQFFDEEEGTIKFKISNEIN